MTDKQTALELCNEYGPRKHGMAAAIVRALQQARDEALDTHSNAAVLRMCHEARMCNGIVDYSDPNATGVVRRVLGTLPIVEVSDTDNGKHELCREVGRRGAIIMQQEQIIALLRAEVLAWRSGWYDDDASEGELARARAATDAAGALEDK